jgi:hypothetical protein
MANYEQYLKSITEAGKLVMPPTTSFPSAVQAIDFMAGFVAPPIEWNDLIRKKLLLLLR